MDVRNCRRCGCLYNYIGGSYRHLCPNCIEDMEKLFQEVKHYIDDNPGVNINNVANEFDITTGQIESWIREDRLVLAEGSTIGISCIQCGRTITSGRYCKECNLKLANHLESMYGTGYVKEENKLRDRKNARMRFLENQ